MASTDEDELDFSIPLSRRRHDKVAVARLNTSLDVSSRLGEIVGVKPLEYIQYPPSSRSSAPGTSPTPPPSTPSSEDSEDSWNLIPYNIPWGPDYVAYAAGTLPGPEGTCIFLRSPTPLKCQRTSQACKSCRERKAKCSGTRPSCERCLARGHSCQYATGTKRNKRAGSGRRQYRVFSNKGRRHYDDMTAAKASVEPESSIHGATGSSYFSMSSSLPPEAPSSADDLVPMDNVNGMEPCQRQFMPPATTRVSPESRSVYAPQPLRHLHSSSLLSIDSVNDQFKEYSCQIHPDPSTLSPSFRSELLSVEFTTGYPNHYQFHDGSVQQGNPQSSYHPTYPLQSDASYGHCVAAENPYTCVDSSSRCGFGGDQQSDYPSFGSEAIFLAGNAPPAGCPDMYGVVMNSLVETYAGF